MSYRIALSPADVGRRVSLRRVLRDGRDGLGDVLGDLVSWVDGTLVIRTRTGDVPVAEADVVSLKPIPAERVRPGTP